MEILFQDWTTYSPLVNAVCERPLLNDICPIVCGLCQWYMCDNYVPQWWVEFDDDLSWLFTNRFSATRYMKVKVQLFWEDHKKFCNLPHGFDIYLVIVKTLRKIAQIFVAFSEKLNFKRMGITEILRWIWLFSTNKTKSS